MEKQLYIERGGRKLFGFLHRPDDPRAALLVCPPLFEEKKSSYRALVELSRALLAEGVASLRFDYRNSGDSDAADGYRLDDLVADAASAADTLRDKAPGVPFSIVGLRIGAAVAARLAGEAAHEPTHLVLVNPIVEGRRYISEILRKMKIRQAFTSGTSRVTRDDLLKGDGTLDFDGIAVPKAFLNDVEAFDLRRCDIPAAAQRTVLQVSHTDKLLSELAPLAAAWKGAAAFGTIVAQAFWNLADFERPAKLIESITRIVKEP